MEYQKWKKINTWLIIDAKFFPRFWTIQKIFQNFQGLFGNFLLQTPKGFQLLTKAVEMRSMELVREIVNDAEARAAESSTKVLINKKHIYY
jgi:hypothetical protein